MKKKFMNFLEKLSQDEMRAITGGYGGGTTLEEYCSTNRTIWEYCCQQMDTACMDNADQAYNTHCT